MHRSVKILLYYLYLIDKSILSNSLSLTKNNINTKKELSTRSIAVRNLILKKGDNYISALDKNIPIIPRLESCNHYKNLSQRDRSFIRKLLTTIQKRHGQVDAILKELCTTYPPKKGKYKGYIESCLRLGTVELLFMNTPSFAAVSEYVEVLKNTHDIPDAMIKFVNGVLRNVSRRGYDLLEEKADIEDNVSSWLLTNLKKDWGDDATALIIKRFMSEVGIDITLKDADKNGNMLLQAFKSWNRDDNEENNVYLLPHGSLRTIKLGGSISSWPYFNEGLWWIQNASASIPAIALIHALREYYDKDNHHVVDMCCAPGGKTAQLLSSDIIHKVTAIEPVDRRSQLLLDNLHRLNLTHDNNLSLKVMKGQDFIPCDDDITGVLLDVPCTATGTCSHRPDVMSNTYTHESLKQILNIQQTLLMHTVDNILSKKGGIIVYSTCSLLKAESEHQILNILKLRPGIIEIIPFQQDEIPGFNMHINKDHGWMRILPIHDNSSEDGFFVVKLLVKSH